MDVEQAMLNTVIAFKLMSYSFSLKCFFKNEFKEDDHYVIPFSIRDCCGYVCPFTDECDGHKFLNFVEKLYDFQKYAVLEEKRFYNYFYFYKFQLKKDNNECEKVHGWDFNSFETKDLSHLTYSKRCQYLN